MIGFFRSSDGNAALEFGILFPVFLMMVMLIVQCGELLYAVDTVNFAVEEAARCAAIDKNNCGTATQVQTYAHARSMNLVPAASFGVTLTAPPCVAANLAFPIMPWFAPSTVNFGFRSCHA